MLNNNLLGRKGDEKDMLKKKLIQTLKNTINNLEEDLDRANFKIECRDNLIKDYQEEHEILLKNDLRKTDFITRLKKLVSQNKYNNEKAVLNKIKELISDYQSQN